MGTQNTRELLPCPRNDKNRRAAYNRGRSSPEEACPVVPSRVCVRVETLTPRVETGNRSEK
jgi:hypothetical protein